MWTLLASLGFLVSPTPALATAITYSDDFTSFSCGNTWLDIPTLSTGGNYPVVSGVYQVCAEHWYGFNTQGNNLYYSQFATVTGNPGSAVRVTQRNLGGTTYVTYPFLNKVIPVRQGVPLDQFSIDAGVFGGTGSSPAVLNGWIYDGRATDVAQMPGTAVSLGALKSCTGTGTPGCSIGSNAPSWSNVSASPVMTPSSHFVTVVLQGTGLTTYWQADNLILTQDLAGVSLDAAGSYGEAWTAYHPDSVAAAAGLAAAVATDAAGNVYVTGGGRSNYGGYDLSTAKYDNDGALQWHAEFDGGNADHATALAMDGAGNVYVTGWSSNGSNKDIITVKYDAAGSQQWAVAYDNGGDDSAAAVKVDGAGNVYVTGSSRNGAGNNDYITLKYDAAGAQQWAARYDNGGLDEVAGLVLDSLGNPYVTGRSYGSDDDYYTVKYDGSNGLPLWANRYNSGDHDDAADVALDETNGTLYVTGHIGNVTTNIITLKLSMAAGAQLGSMGYDGNNIDQAIAVKVDGSGNVFVAGRTGIAGSADYALVKFNAGAIQQWIATYDNGGANDELTGLALDTAGNPYVTGTSTTTAGVVDYLTIAYDGATGAQTALKIYDNAGNDRAAAIAVGTDGSGDAAMYVTGTSYDGSYDNYGTVAYKVMRPDLTVSAVSAPASGLLGGDIAVSDTVSNDSHIEQGAGADAGAFGVGFYLAPQVGGAPDYSSMVAMGSRTVASLASTASDSATTMVTIPAAGVAAGTYYVVAVADSAGALTEKDETNNRLVSSTITLSDAPDLIAVSLSGPASASAGSSLSLSYSQRNDRSPSSGAFDTTFVLSPDTTLNDANDVVLGSLSSADLAGNTTDSGSVAFTVPNSLAAGNYYLGVLVDSGSAVTESRDDNNTYVTAGTISITAIPDLAMAAVSSSSLGVAPGQSFTVSDTVANTTADAGAFAVGYYLSTDATITTSDTLIGTRAVTGVLAGGSDSGSATAMIPEAFSLAPGTYYLGAIADSGNAVTEVNEGNNSLVASQTLTLNVSSSVGGDNSDGSATVAGTFNLNSDSSDSVLGNAGDGNGAQPDGYSTLLTVGAAAGATTLSVASTAGFVSGDEILVIQVVHDSNHGIAEFVQNVTVVDGTTLSFGSGLANNYYAAGTTAQGTANTVQVVRVPHYSSLTVPAGTTLTTSAFNTGTRLGGVLAFRAGTVTVDGSIQADALGLAGGPAAVAGVSYVYGTQGWSYTGQGSYQVSAANAGGGGGSVSAGYGGGGAGYGATGINAASGGLGGTAYGNAQLSRIYLGSGGGSGSALSATSGKGGNGGGIVYVGAGTLNIAGTISSKGQNGSNASASGTRAGGGGGGSGGSIYLAAVSSNVTGSVTATGGGAGAAGGGGCCKSAGGAGAVGRIAQFTAQPDLVVSAVSGPTTAARGDTISVTTTVGNAGSAAAGSFKVGIYLSDDTAITTADTLIGDCTLTGLAAGGSSTLITGSSPECTNATIPLTLYNTSYNYRKPITIDAAMVSGTGTLTDFPVLISLTDPDLRTVANGGKVENANGYDIAVRAADGSTSLDYEVEKYDATTGEWIAWVKVPLLSATTNTTLYLYYGDQSLTATQETPAAVWDANYSAVWHMSEDPSTAADGDCGGGTKELCDSTANNNDGDSAGAMASTALIAGQVGGALDFDGVNDYITGSFNPGMNTATAYSMSMWVNTTYNATALWQVHLLNLINSAGTDGYGSDLDDGERPIIYTHGQNTTAVAATSGIPLRNTGWRYVTTVFDQPANQARIYVDGVLNYQVNSYTDKSATTGTVFKMATGWNLSGFSPMKLDELRISSTARSVDWIATEFNNQNSPATFYALGVEENVSTSGQTYYIGAIADYAAQVSELSEANNTSIQTGVGGSPQATSVGVAIGTEGGSGGGGASDALWLMMLALFAGWRRRLPPEGDRAAVVWNWAIFHDGGAPPFSCRFSSSPRHFPRAGSS